MLKQRQLLRPTRNQKFAKKWCEQRVCVYKNALPDHVLAKTAIPTARSLLLKTNITHAGGFNFLETADHHEIFAMSVHITHAHQEGTSTFRRTLKWSACS